MESETSAVSTKDWIEATKGMTIIAYIEPNASTLVEREQPITKENFDDALRKVSRPIAQRAEPQPGKEKSET
jgi:predicted secreted protein